MRRAAVQQWRNTILRLRKQAAIDQERLKTLRRSQGLAEDEFERLKNLFDQDQVGTRSGVDAAERAANTARDQADQMRAEMKRLHQQNGALERKLRAQQGVGGPNPAGVAAVR